jgi:hypothetical protein
MDWIKWLIPLVVVFVVILSNLARIAQEEKKTNVRRRPGQGGPGDKPPRPRRTQSEAERFLEEINRRRRQASEQRRPVVVQRTPAPARPVVQKPPRRETPSANDPLARSAPAQPAVPAAAAEASMPSRRLPAQQPQGVRQPTPVLEEVVVATVVPAQPPGEGPLTAPAVSEAAKSENPAAVTFRQLLRNRQSLKTAFILREVLDRPLCRRPPRGPRMAI